MKPRTWFALSVAVALVLAPAPGPAGASGIFQVTSSAARDRHPTWDLDDQSVVFESNRSGHYHLYRLRVGETQAQQLTSGDSNEMMPEISPDGTRIVFASGLADMGGALLSSSLQVMPAQGGPATTLVPNTGPFIWHPTWSPDGQSIYYLFWGSSTGNYFEDIYRVSSSGGVPEKVVDIEEDAYPRISPDGRQIAFALREHGGPYNIAQAPLTDPSNYVLLTQETVNTSQPDYSPDGTLLVYVSRKINDALELYEMNLATSTSQRLTSDSDVWSHETYTQFPEYSHDGNWIAFSSARVTGDENIWLFSRTGESPFGNVLSAGSGQGLPGGGAVRVPISLECAQAAPALEFQVHDVPDLLTVTGVQVRDRAMNMTASFATDSGAHVVLYSPAGRMIPAGTGVILDLLVEVKPSAELGETVALELSDIVLADAAGSAVETDAVPGSFLVARLTGDLNGDNLVDVGDLVRLVEIILGTGHPATPEELDLADCNDDGSVNALDIVCLLDVILNAAPPLTPQAPALAGAGSGTDLVIRTGEEVRGLQITGAGVPVADTDLAPFTLHTGSGKAVALAFDPAGGAWTEGASVTLHTTQRPADIRAYGPGGSRLTVTVSGNTVTIGKPLPAGLRALPALPNPFRAGTTLRFSMDAPGKVAITVFDLQGRKVSEVEPREYPAGEHEVSWKATDLSGRSLPAGLYFARVQSGGRHASVRLVNLGG